MYLKNKNDIELIYCKQHVEWMLRILYINLSGLRLLLGFQALGREAEMWPKFSLMMAWAPLEFPEKKRTFSREF